MAADGPDREWLPVTILLPMLLSGFLAAGWGLAGVMLIWLIRAFPSPEGTTSSILWGGLVLLAIVANVAIMIGLARRVTWMRWAVVAQAVVTTALLMPTPFGIWAGLLLAGQVILLFLPLSRRWFGLDAVPPRPRTDVS